MTQDYNNTMRAAALSILPQGESIGSPKWVRAGSALQPWTTGGSMAEGWNHDFLVAGNERLILSNHLARPRFYLDATKRQVGYGPGERPADWKWTPGSGDAPDGGQYVGRKIVYGCDSEHFLAGQLLSLAAAEQSPMIDFGGWSAPANEAARDILYFVRQSALGMCRPGMWYPAIGDKPANRPSDRTIARLLYILVRCGEWWPYVGQDLEDLKSAIELFLTFQEQGPATFTKAQQLEPPLADGEQYWMFVQYVGYGIPVWEWILHTNLPWIPKERIISLVAAMGYELHDYLKMDGSTPWAISEKSSLAHYYTSPNGDAYTPGYEVYAACRIRGLLAPVKSIFDRYNAMPEGAQKELQRPWLVDENGKAVV